jgi:hypothetical protein
MVGGLAALLTRSPRLGRQERVRADTWHAVEVQMRAGRITGLEDARRYLRAHWGSDDRSLNGVSQLFQHHMTKPKTGWHHHRQAKPAAQRLG